MKEQKPIKRILVNKEGKQYFLRDLTNDFHCEYGFFKKTDLKKKKGTIKTNKDKPFTIFEPFFSDHYKKIKRDAQIISLKDVGLIIAETGIGKTSKVLDAGAGSGALALFLANIAKEVISYEIRDDFINIVKKNITLLGLKNYKVKKNNIYEKMLDKNLDVIILDLPEPWQAIDNAGKGLKSGGFLVSYSPSIPQTTDFVNYILTNKAFMHVKTLEVTAKEWEIEGRKVRPKTRQLGHTGFLSFCRRL